MNKTIIPLVVNRAKGQYSLRRLLNLGYVNHNLAPLQWSILRMNKDCDTLPSLGLESIRLW